MGACRPLPGTSCPFLSSHRCVRSDGRPRTAAWLLFWERSVHGASGLVAPKPASSARPGAHLGAPPQLVTGTLGKTRPSGRACLLVTCGKAAVLGSLSSTCGSNTSSAGLRASRCLRAGSPCLAGVAGGPACPLPLPAAGCGVHAWSRLPAATGDVSALRSETAELEGAGPPSLATLLFRRGLLWGLLWGLLHQREAGKRDTWKLRVCPLRSGPRTWSSRFGARLVRRQARVTR